MYSGKTHDDTLLAKFESVYTGAGDHGSSMVSIHNLFNVYSLCCIWSIIYFVFTVCT